MGETEGNGTIHRESWYWTAGIEALDFTDYIQVNRTLIRKLGLNEAVLIGELAYECRTWKRKGKINDGWFYSTVENVERQTGINAYYQRLALQHLSELGVVEVEYYGLPRSRHIRVSGIRVTQLMEDECENTPSNQQSCTQCMTGDAPSEPLVDHPVHANKEVSKRNNRKKDTLSGKPDDVPYDAVIDYLNEKTGKHYRSKAAATRKLIKARFAEGYTLEDFRRVIDTKTSQWLNTDQDKFLRPETLFRPSHFESYLNEAPQTSILDSVDWSKYQLDEIDPSTIH